MPCWGSTAAGRWSLGISAVLIAAYLFAAFAEARLKSPTSDEMPHIAAGLSYFITHEIFRANPEHPPLLKELSGLSMMAAGVHWPHTPDADYLVNGDDPDRIYQSEWTIGNEVIYLNGMDRVMFWARLPMILIGALLAALLYLWGRQLFGPVAAAGAVFVCVLDPTLFAHSQLVTTDVGEACFAVLTLFALWNYLRRPHWVRLVLCGLSLGAGLDAKFSGIILLPIVGLLMLASIRWPARSGDEKSAPSGAPPAKTEAPPLKPLPPSHAAKRGAAPAARRKGLCPCGSGKRYKNCHGQAAAGASLPTGPARKLALLIGVFALLAIVAFVFIQATYFFPSDLAMYEKCFRMVNANHNPNYLAYLAGHLKHRFTGYFLVAYGVKQPLAAIVFTLIGLVALIRAKAVPLLGKLFVLVPAAVFFIAATFMADDLGIRYIIPVMPFLHLIAGLGIATLIQSGRKFRWAPYTAGALGAWLVVGAAGIYPDHISYFNEAACLFTDPSRIGWDGGTRCGTLWLDDSNVDWGQGLKQLKAWQDRNAPGRDLKLSITTSFPPEAYGIRCRRTSADELFQGPKPGLYAVSAFLVARIPALPGANQWLRHTKPTAIVGHAIYIYDVAEASPRQ